MLRKALIALAFLATPSVAFAAKAEKHYHPPPGGWSFEEPFGTFDRGAVQRGFQVYKEVCSSCHGMQYLSYRNLGEKNGPFAAYAPRDWQDSGVMPELVPSGHGGHLVDANENPYVRAIAAEYEVSELDAQTGETITRPARPSDRFKYPWENEAQGRLANGGAYPPDLSVITYARHGGASYIYSLLLGYTEELPPGVEPQEGRYFNDYFPGGWIAMPPQLIPDRVTYSDGTAATPEQMAKDVATFLAWASEPKMESRKQLGLIVLIYLSLLTALVYVAYRQVWRNESH